MQARFEFRGTGGELFKNLFVGMLLTSITFGIYLPWYLVSLTKLILGRTKIYVGERELQLDFNGNGLELLKQSYLGYLLTGWTLGIYFPWFITRLIKFQLNHMTAYDEEGNQYALHSTLTGGDLFKAWFLGGLLTSITFGIYAPWFVCNLTKLMAERTEVQKGDETIGTFTFVGQGGELLKEFLLGYLLVGVTMGIYMFWFQVKMFKFISNGTQLTLGENVYRGDFTGQGGENFKVNLVGYLLTMITFGVYGFWYFASVLKFRLDNTRFVLADELGLDVPEPARASSSRAAAPARAPKPARAAASSFDLGDADLGPDDGRAIWARAFLPQPGREPSTSKRNGNVQHASLSADLLNTAAERELSGPDARTIRQEPNIPEQHLADVWDVAATDSEGARPVPRANSHSN